MGHSEKKIFNKNFLGANSELNSLYISKENTLNSEEWPNLEKHLLNAMAQVFPLNNISHRTQVKLSSWATIKSPVFFLKNQLMPKFFQIIRFNGA